MCSRPVTGGIIPGSCKLVCHPTEKAVTTNPLLNLHDLPPFESIRADHVRPAVEQVIHENLAAIEALIAQPASDWDGFVGPFEDLDERLQRIWSVASHLNAVIDDEDLRAAYGECLPLLSDYGTTLAHDPRIYTKFRTLRESGEFNGLAEPQRRIIDNALRDFHLAGVDLPAEKKARFKAIQSELATLANGFEQNLLQATDHWQLHLESEDRLAGLPENSVALARQEAESRSLDGWVFTLQAPSYIPFMTFAEDRELRRQMYEAFVTRASETGPDAGRWDNGLIIDDILRLRRESAALLGYDDYVDYALQTRMAKSATEVQDFLESLVTRARPIALDERAELETYARDLGVTELQAWDLAYFSEKLRQARHAISQEALRPWFPLDRVLDGLFTVVERLFGLSIRPREDVPLWHPDVRFYEIYAADGQLRGRFYLDLYARKGKRGGAWMGDGISRKRTAQGVQAPLAWLVCNFSRPVGQRPCLLTHDEVTTLFHEFGHGLHHMLTRIDYPAVAGINGVPWDAVELPSQLLENWCWEEEVLDLLSGHYESGEPLPAEMVDRLLAARNFQAGMQLVRQLEFALFDLLIHRGRQKVDVQQVLDRVRREVAVVIPPAYNRFQHGFSHIFAGGYASGYYSYSWAEVLSADAYSLFEERGIFDRETGKAFLETVLEQGGSREPLDLFVAFRGRTPEIDAFLRHRGIAA